MIDDSFLAGIAGFVIYTVAVAISLRIWPKNTSFMVIAITVPIYIGTLLTCVFVGGKISFWNYSALYGALTLTFLMIFGAVYKSISLRLLLDLYEAPDRTDTHRAVLDRLVRQDSFDARIIVMQQTGFARLEDGVLILERKGARLARMVKFVQTVFGIDKSG